MLNDLNIPLDIVALISLGFFGGFTHCSGMCGPFVLTQVSNRLQQVEVKNFSNFEKLKNLALLPYHFGRITTYSIIGFFCSFFTKNIQEFVRFKFISGILLLLASLFFLNIFFEKKITKKIMDLFRNHPSGKAWGVGWSAEMESAKICITDPAPNQPSKRFRKGGFKRSLWKFLPKTLSPLFLNPRGLNGYLLGLVLGFIPCGLLYGAFLISASITKPYLACIGMFLFGISTIPSLLLVASGSYFFFKIDSLWFKKIAQIIILMNAILLLMLGIKIIRAEF